MLKQNDAEHTPVAVREPAGRIKTFLAVLGGADPRIIAKVPETAFHFAEIAVVLLGTALIAGLSMMFALTSGVGLPLQVAIPLAIVWAVIILSLDRFLTSQMKSSRNILKLLGAALPRIALAAIIGVIVAVPMTIRIFQSEVNAEVGEMRRATSAELSAKLDNGEVAKALAKQRERISELRAQAAQPEGGA